jgi:Fe2+ transport system protein FeoA
MCGSELADRALSVCDHCPLQRLSGGCTLELVPCAQCGYHALPDELVASSQSDRRDHVVPAACGAEGSRDTRPLGSLRAGTRARVARVDCGDEAVDRRLLAYGLAPGARVEVLQRRPALILRIYETELALAPEVAAGIAVAVAPTAAAGADEPSRVRAAG